MLTNELLDALIAGLDPAIHHFGIEIVFTMDARVKPAHDESGFVKPWYKARGSAHLRRISGKDQF